jgi:undecaprenyl-diphosphatase
MDYLIQADRHLFRLINSEWSNPVMDALSPFIRNSMTWVPFYLFLILLIVTNFRQNRFWWVVFAAGTAILTNFVSSDLIKENIFRLRPCNDPTMAEHLRFLLNYKPQSSSFTSSHATNHFGLAMYLHQTLKAYIGRWTRAFFIWALVIIYAQVYVGVHFPLDVACGAGIGLLFGYLSARSYNQQYGLS